MSLCLMHVHGDIEGDYEFVCDIPNGTNGEVIKALFPKLELGELVYNTRRYFLMGEAIETFDFKTTDKWWNAPYEKGGEEK